MLPLNAFNIHIKGYEVDIDYRLHTKDICVDIENIYMEGEIHITYYDSGCMCQRKQLYGNIVDGVLVLDV